MKVCLPASEILHVSYNKGGIVGLIMIIIIIIAVTLEPILLTMIMNKK